jgi:hypothetical protein
MAESHPRQGAARKSKSDGNDKSTECRYCNRDFESYIARRKHEGKSHDTPYKDEGTLRELYCESRLSMADIADRLDTSDSTIRYWMDKHDIEPRDPHDHERRVGVNLSLDNRGYMRWSEYDAKHKNNRFVQVHRLLAVAKYGFEEVCGMNVHHKDNIGWDNRPENIELMTDAEHASHHYNEHPRNR